MVIHIIAEQRLLLCGGRDGGMISWARSVSDGPSPLTEEGHPTGDALAPQESDWKCLLLTLLFLERTELQLYKFTYYLLKHLFGSLCFCGVKRSELWEDYS